MWGILVALLSGALMSVQGVFNTELTKQDQPLGIHRLGTDFSLFNLCVCLAFYRTGGSGCTFAGRPQIPSAGRGYRRFYYCDGDSEYVISWACPGGYAHCGGSACGRLCVELLGLFGVEKVDFEWRRLIGMAVAIVGIIIFKWENRQKQPWFCGCFLGLPGTDGKCYTTDTYKIMFGVSAKDFQIFIKDCKGKSVLFYKEVPIFIL